MLLARVELPLTVVSFNWFSIGRLYLIETFPKIYLWLGGVTNKNLVGSHNYDWLQTPVWSYGDQQTIVCLLLSVSRANYFVDLGAHVSCCN